MGKMSDRSLAKSQYIPQRKQKKAIAPAVHPFAMPASVEEKQQLI